MSAARYVGVPPCSGRADDHAVVFVAVLRGPGPDRPVLLVGVQPGHELGQPLGELALQRPRVEVDPEPLERRLDLLEHPRHRVALDLRQLRDVRAPIAVLGRLLPAPDRLDRGAEAIHLRARVVVVVLALDRVSRVGEDARDRVAVGPVSSRCDRDRPGRVRGHHLDLHPLGRVCEAAAVGLPRVEDLPQRVEVPRGREPEVHESGACDLGPLDSVQRRRLLDDLLGDLPRRPLPLRRELERGVRREVAVLRAGGPLERRSELRPRAARAP